MNELYHHGIKGMKWGVRRYQNPDGSLTDLGRRRAGIKERRKQKSLSRYSSARYTNYNVKELSDAELRKRINRLQMEKQLRDLSENERSRGMKFTERLLEQTGQSVISTVISGTALYLISRQIEKRWGENVARSIIPGGLKKNKKNKRK